MLPISGLPVKIITFCNVRGPNVVFEVEYLGNGPVKKNGVNANRILCNSFNFE